MNSNPRTTNLHDRDERRECLVVEPLLSAWIDGAVGGDEAARVSEHLPVCSDCARVAEGLVLVADAATVLLPTGRSRRPRPATRPGVVAVDRFVGTLARLVRQRRRTLSRLVRRILAQRLLRHHHVVTRGDPFGPPDEQSMVDQSRTVAGELLGLESGQEDVGARLHEMIVLLDRLDPRDPRVKAGAEFGGAGLRRAVSVLRAFEELAPLAPPLPVAEAGRSAELRWARAELVV